MTASLFPLLILLVLLATTVLSAASFSSPPAASSLSNVSPPHLAGRPNKPTAPSRPPPRDNLFKCAALIAQCVRRLAGESRNLRVTSAPSSLSSSASKKFIKLCNAQSERNSAHLQSVAKSAQNTVASSARTKRAHSYFVKIVSEEPAPYCYFEEKIYTRATDKILNLSIPINVRLKQVHSTWAILYWNDTNITRSSIYQIKLNLKHPERHPDGPSAVIGQPNNTSKTQTSLTGLLPHMDYVVRVRKLQPHGGGDGRREMIASDWSFVKDFSTLSDRPKDSPLITNIYFTPGKQQADQFGTFGTFISWNPPRYPNGKILEYKIFWTSNKNMDFSKYSKKLVPGTDTRHFFEEGLLKPNTLYYFLVTCRNVNGTSPASPVFVYRSANINGYGAKTIPLPRDFHDAQKIPASYLHPHYLQVSSSPATLRIDQNRLKPFNGIDEDGRDKRLLNDANSKHIMQSKNSKGKLENLEGDGADSAASTENKKSASSGSGMSNLKWGIITGSIILLAFFLILGIIITVVCMNSNRLQQQHRRQQLQNGQQNLPLSKSPTNALPFASTNGVHNKIIHPPPGPPPPPPQSNCSVPNSPSKLYYQDDSNDAHEKDTSEVLSAEMGLLNSPNHCPQNALPANLRMQNPPDLFLHTPIKSSILDQQQHSHQHQQRQQHFSANICYSTPPKESMIMNGCSSTASSPLRQANVSKHHQSNVLMAGNVVPSISSGAPAFSNFYATSNNMNSAVGNHFSIPFSPAQTSNLQSPPRVNAAASDLNSIIDLNPPQHWPSINSSGFGSACNTGSASPPFIHSHSNNAHVTTATKYLPHPVSNLSIISSLHSNSSASSSTRNTNSNNDDFCLPALPALTGVTAATRGKSSLSGCSDLLAMNSSRVLQQQQHHSNLLSAPDDDVTRQNQSAAAITNYSHSHPPVQTTSICKSSTTCSPSFTTTPFVSTSNQNSLDQASASGGSGGEANKTGHTHTTSSSNDTNLPLLSSFSDIHGSNTIDNFRSSEELCREVANLEGLMKDLNAITQKEFEC